MLQQWRAALPVLEIWFSLREWLVSGGTVLATLLGFLLCGAAGVLVMWLVWCDLYNYNESVMSGQPLWVSHCACDVMSPVSLCQNGRQVMFEVVCWPLVART